MTGHPAFPLAFAVGWSVLVLGTGGALTEIGAWYRELRKPSWQPPDWLFGPAWTLIFVAASFAFVSAWRGTESEGARSLLALAYVVNGALNVLWSWLFFGRRRPDTALLEIAPLWGSIVLMMLAAGAMRPSAVLLLAPYLAWVTFATVLNRAIVRLNGPFA